MNIHLDLTTNTSIFNPLSAKGQWVHHRFGARNLNLELDFDIVKHVLNQASVNNITLNCTYGDSLSYTNIDNLLDYCHDKKKYCTIITYGSNIEQYIEKISEYNFMLFLKLCDKVYLNADIENILDVCKNYKNVMIENTIFKHNDSDKIKQICQDNQWIYLEQRGYDLSGFCTSIIDEHSNWLYDVHSTNSNETRTLIKSTKAWHRLKMFVKPMNGESILNKPYIPHTQYTDDWLPANDDIVVSLSGHVIKNLERASIFANALCPDWDGKKLDLDSDYNLKICGVLNKFNKKNLSDYSLHHRRFNQITPFC